MKILLAEDDFVTRKFMVNFLSKYGECDVTVDGMEAVDAFMMALEDGEPYDLSRYHDACHGRLSVVSRYPQSGKGKEYSGR